MASKSWVDFAARRSEYNHTYYLKHQDRLLANARRVYLENNSEPRQVAARARSAAFRREHRELANTRSQVSSRRRSAIERLNRIRIRKGFPRARQVTAPTFLGYPIVCNNFLSCTNHTTCREWRNSNHPDAHRYRGPRGKKVAS